MKKITVGIVGHKGKYGLFLQRMFSEHGCEVIGADAQDGEGVIQRNAEVVTMADVVVFSVPPRIVTEVIGQLLHHSRPDQLWMDITSIKVAPVNAMLESRAEVIGLHPMCAPNSLRGQTIVVCPARLEKWQTWTDSFLASTGARLKVCTPEEHDRTMATVQALTHAMQLTMASTIKSLGQDVKETLSFTSPFYRIALSLMGRILHQDAQLYADIQMLNPHVPVILEQTVEELNILVKNVITGDQVAFVEQFMSSKKHFGTKVIDDNNALFEDLIQLLSNRVSNRQVLLQITENKPGILHGITEIFLKSGINLEHVHSFRNANGFHFLIGIDRPPEDPTVILALESITKLNFVVIK